MMHMVISSTTNGSERKTDIRPSSNKGVEAGNSDLAQPTTPPRTAIGAVCLVVVPRGYRCLLPRRRRARLPASSASPSSCTTACVVRLSALPDDLLQHILSFTPAKEAATSAVLSRRWRPLWRRTGVLNLDNRHYSAQDRYGCFDVFFRDAMAALAAYRRRRGTTTLKRLTLFLTEGAYRPLKRWYSDPNQKKKSGSPASSPTPRRPGWKGSASPPRSKTSATRCTARRWAPCRSPQRSGCWSSSTATSKTPPPSARLAFPCLTDLTLRHCFALEGNLQALVDDAPTLTSLPRKCMHNMKQQGVVVHDLLNRMYSST
ncbi:hypothetical protein D1007_27167 [Hordeum vulgare]|nr:hypothetical protein D1007_27167 [Hordeum vulgare]